jgi:hypothetical protein
MTAVRAGAAVRCAHFCTKNPKSIAINASTASVVHTKPPVGVRS